MSQEDVLGKKISGRGNRKCKGPVTGARPPCRRAGTEVGLSIAEWLKNGTRGQRRCKKANHTGLVGSEESFTLYSGKAGAAGGL